MGGWGVRYSVMQLSGLDQLQKMTIEVLYILLQMLTQCGVRCNSKCIFTTKENGSAREAPIASYVDYLC